MPKAAIPVNIIPQNMTCTGPMTLSLGTVAKQDKELAKWLIRAPTILVNLGSGFEFSKQNAIIMAEAITKILRSSRVQVLWKIKKDSSYTDQFLKPLLPFADVGRVKVERWLAADPSSLLESGHVIAAGVPQVILPQWLDLYGFAQLAEYTGVGVWACRETSPMWTVNCVFDALLEVINGTDSQSFRDKAAALQLLAQANPGRYVAASEIARLAGTGT
ncbi:hypothetical protein NPX13_g9013 [Xylaria arbuscula]|uniref:Uncharacterized protein n=1 Tax=Xylaria arbuscula TaxID=114810 RepID=A0A9W8N7D2_9PEZI|nr:hypothetical protein NPX13_g9013 [Xylaria arbuscula]